MGYYTIENLKKLKSDFSSVNKLNKLIGNIEILQEYHKLISEWIIYPNKKRGISNKSYYRRIRTI